MCRQRKHSRRYFFFRVRKSWSVRPFKLWPRWKNEHCSSCVKEPRIPLMESSISLSHILSTPVDFYAFTGYCCFPLISLASWSLNPFPARFRAFRTLRNPSAKRTFCLPKEKKILLREINGVHSGGFTTRKHCDRSPIRTFHLFWVVSSFFIRRILSSRKDP